MDEPMTDRGSQRIVREGDIELVCSSGRVAPVSDEINSTQASPKHTSAAILAICHRRPLNRCAV
jgi:hypothetical protein